ncbi:TolC family outer membrane protein [Actibacterium sp.]|uniref:TolC family outer membrane protein n=1 Tax=Actibacterium sp. TaxID=1872125 RepID=UPI003562B77D
MKQVIRGAIVGMVSALALGVGSANAETLTDALSSAYQNSNLLEQNRALLRAADEGVASAMAALRPIVGFTASSSYSNSPTASNLSNNSITLGAELTLYEGGSNKLAVEAAKETVLSTRASLLALEQNVLLGAVQAYLDVRSASENVALRNNNVRLITEQLRAARDRFEVGEVTRTDVSLAESRLAASQSALAAAQGALIVARESYKLAVGHAPSQLTGTLRVPGLPKTQAEALEIARRGHPNIDAAQRQVNVSDLNLLRARAARMPKLTAEAGVGYADSSNNILDGDSSSVGLTLTQPLYAGGKIASAERAALAGREASMANLHYVAKQVEQGVGNTWAQLAVARAQLEATDKQIRAAQLAFDGTREEARLGSRTTLDVLDAEQDLLDARTARVQAEASQYVAYYALLASMGLLTVEHLNLGIPTYDPAAYYNSVKSGPTRSIQGEKLDEVMRALGRK